MGWGVSSSCTTSVGQMVDPVEHSEPTAASGLGPTVSVVVEKVK